MEFTPEYIIKTVSDFYRVPIDMTVSTCRRAEYITARQVSMYFMRELIDKIPLREVGLNFSGNKGFKSHCTVLHACKTVNNMIETDKHYNKNIYKLRESFGCENDEIQKENEDEKRIS